MAKIIDGNRLAQQIHQEIEEQVGSLRTQGVHPCLAVVLVGEDPASQVYVGRKQKACEQFGIVSRTLLHASDFSERELLRLIADLNADSSVHGILVQLPLPGSLSSSRVIQAISPEKDVDGFHPVNRGKLAAGEECYAPCTPAGIQEMLIRERIDTAGKHVVIVGRSGIVGMPLAVMLSQKKPGANATVTLCHTATRDLGYHTRQAEILIVASGRACTVTAEMVQEGCVVIDVGVNRVADPSHPKGYRLVGDVDFAAVEKKASAISPVPGGVGPMTIAMLLKNTLQAARKQSAAVS